ncbi:MAG: peptidase M20 [Rhodospirillaceae bacterium TMED167]|nr:peptidase M20 [Rhodospirillaceae bacterium]OUW27665.1 MAG: peptidase M20 [Rhodospirillaceae bacterium TMED167]
MSIIDQITACHDEMTAWRRDLHAYPETAFEEIRTADFVAKKLESFGIAVHRGLAKTGLVGTLTNGTGGAIGLRADMDALDMEEQADVGYASKVPGKMHACGHDGHTTMLLGAAKYLSETRKFNGTVHFIFQPAEEMVGGGRVMVEEGLFEKFDVASVYGMHNWPNMPAGKMSVRAGPAMASAASFEIMVTGKGSHAAAPHQGIDPIMIGAKIVTALQTISSRITNPIEGIVVSITQFHAGDAMNVLPDRAALKGTARSFAEDAPTAIEPLIRRIAENTAAAHGGAASLEYSHLYPVLINSERESDLALRVAEDVVGSSDIYPEYPPSMASEDFSFMLNERPGCFMRLGTGFNDRETFPLHSTRYEFNDDVLPIGASYWARLVETVLI